MKFSVSFGIIASLFFSNAALAKDYYVSPEGNDQWSGTLKQPNAQRSDGPFKTLGEAKQAIRALKKISAFNEKVTVTIAAGRYYLPQPLHFNVMDSGLPDREIVWQGETGAQVTISGGLPVICKKRDATFWDCPLTQIPVNKEFIDNWLIRGNAPKFELFVNEEKLQLARWPDQGWAHIKLPITQNTEFSVMEALPTFSDKENAAQVHIFAGNEWFDQFIGIKKINKPANSITLSSSTSYPLDSGRRFYIQNLPSLLNASGEWIYDETARNISFIPQSGTTPKEIMLSSLPNLLIAEGIKHLTFKNLSFQYSAGTAITVKDSSNVVMDQLDVNNIGGKGVEIIGGQNVQLKNSKIHHTGFAAVSVSGGDRTALTPSGHVIYNNHIHHMSTVIFTYTPGVEVSGVGVIVTHNLLEQGPHSAITIAGNDHLIEKNELHHFCLQASDCGAIYTGRNWSWLGNIIRYNYIHDIIGYGRQSVDVAKNQVDYQSPFEARGVFLDDGVSGFEVSGNIFENAGTEALLMGGGRDNVVVNNYIYTNNIAIYLDGRDQSANQKTLDDSPYKTSIWQQKYPGLKYPIHNKAWPEGNKFEQNIIVTRKPGGKSLLYWVPKESTVISNNIVWSTTGELLVDYNVMDGNGGPRGDSPWLQWIAEGVEKGSIVADPCVKIVNKQMITCPGSPIKDIGFKPLPTDIGLIP